MTTCTHVSDSLAGKVMLNDAKANENADENADESADEHTDKKKDGILDKDVFVTQFVVQSAFLTKKRKLAQMVDKEVDEAVFARAKALQCGCGCMLAPCKKRKALRDEYIKKTAHKVWPALEKELMAEIADSLVQARRANIALRKELADSRDEVMVLRYKMAVVGSVF